MNTTASYVRPAQPLSPGKPGSLAGVKVLDLSRFIAGPYCAMLLGDLGADVVKVESVGKGENSRIFEPQFGGESLYTVVFNRNKRSLTLNFRSPQGQELLRGLIAKTDIVVENFVPGTLEKMGCGWETLSKINPRLIMTRISGFGSTGPYSSRPCFDVIAQAMSGLMDITGPADGPPTTAGTFVVDYATALYASIGTMAALHHREKTGEGQLVEATLLGSAMSMLMTAIPDQLLFGRTMARNGSRDRFNAPGNTFRTADGHWILLLTVGDDKFRALAECMHRTDLLENPMFSTNLARMQNVDAIEGIVQAWTSKHQAGDVLSLLEANGIPCTKVATIADLVENPHVLAREHILNLPQAGGTIPVQGFALELGQTPMALRHPAPSVGQHSDEVLNEWLDIGAGDLEALKRNKTI
jgi:crotonobetainyl-CoA:carnitine CoA-transferase CaiB-like acyl-CoA transferase